MSFCKESSQTQGMTRTEPCLTLGRNLRNAYFQVQNGIFTRVCILLIMRQDQSNIQSIQELLQSNTFESSTHKMQPSGMQCIYNMKSSVPSQRLNRTKGDLPTLSHRSQRVISDHIRNTNPGPGTYDPLTDTQHTSRYHIPKKDNNKGSKQYAWMHSQTRSRGFFKGQNNRNMGPGAYSVQDKQHQSNVICFKSSRFNPMITPVSHVPGPGSYDSAEAMKREPSCSSAFKSKVRRCDSSHRRYQSQEDELYRLLARQRMKKKVVSSGQLRKQPKNKVKTSFVSKVPRFVTQVGPTQAGPGSYNLDQSHLSIDNKKVAKHLKHRVKSRQRKPKKESVNVGPGSYNLNKYSMSRQIQWKGVTIAKQGRFESQLQNSCLTENIPGPGTYMQTPKGVVVYENRDFRMMKPLKQRTKTEVKEEEFSDSTQRREQYQLKFFDISERIKRKMSHYDKLKRMKVELAAFDSKVPRLS